MPVQEKHNVMEMYISLQATVQCITWKINILKCSTFCYTNNSASICFSNDSSK